jgi:hypothetical protein
VALSPVSSRDGYLYLLGYKSATTTFALYRYMAPDTNAVFVGDLVSATAAGPPYALTAPTYGGRLYFLNGPTLYTFVLDISTVIRSGSVQTVAAASVPTTNIVGLTPLRDHTVWLVNTTGHSTLVSFNNRTATVTPLSTPVIASVATTGSGVGAPPYHPTGGSLLTVATGTSTTWQVMPANYSAFSCEGYGACTPYEDCAVIYEKVARTLQPSEARDCLCRPSIHCDVPCQHGGLCSGVNTCNCANTGYTDSICSTEIDGS